MHVVPSESTYWPNGQVYVHVAFPGSNTPPARQDVQVALALHSAQLESQEKHSGFAPAYFPLGQAATHVPASKRGVPVKGQLVHSVLPEPLHSRHEESQAIQVATVPTRPENVPLLGQSAMHVPLWRNGVTADVQLKQSELDGPLQVPQAASQGWQMLLLSAYLPIGRHDERHVPDDAPAELKKGEAGTQVLQSVANGPVHVAQDASHATHESIEAGLPPEHV